MKKLVMISAVSALAASVMAGCNGDTDGNSSKINRCVATVAQTGSDVVRTEYRYEEGSSTEIGQVQTLNGKKVYEIDDYQYGAATFTRYRTTYNDGSTIRHKLVSTYNSNGSEIAYEVFLENGTSVEKTETQYNHYEYYDFPTSIVYTKEGREVFRREEFDYYGMSSYSSSTPWFTFLEIRDGVETTMCQKWTEILQGILFGYEVYSDWDGTNGTLIEKKGGYGESVGKRAYTITRYVNGIATETKITEEMETVTVK